MDAWESLLERLREQGVTRIAFIDRRKNPSWDPTGFNVVHLTPRRKVVLVPRGASSQEKQKPETKESETL